MSEFYVKKKSTFSYERELFPIYRVEYFLVEDWRNDVNENSLVLGIEIPILLLKDSPDSGKYFRNY